MGLHSLIFLILSLLGFARRSLHIKDHTLASALEHSAEAREAFTPLRSFGAHHARDAFHTASGPKQVPRAVAPRDTATGGVTRRAALLHAATAAIVPLAVPLSARADEELAVATFSGGDPRFLQKYFDQLKYAGIKSCEIGILGDTPGIRVTFNANKISYKRVVGAFWRACDPTSAEQFGNAVPTIIWTASDEQRSIAEESRRRLQRATEYSSSTFGPMYRGRPILTEVRPLAREWVPGPSVDQDWYINEPEAYERAGKKTGRTKWLDDAYKPVTVTACQKNAGEGAVCGFVYFPCSDENGCTDVIQGRF